MTALLAEVQALGWAGFVVFLRVGAVMALLPGFGNQSVPVRVRLVLTVALTAIVAPAAVQSIALPPAALPTLIWFLVTESVIGLLIGGALRLFVLALQTAGSIAAQATSLSQLLGAASGEPLPTIGHILTVSGLALLMITGLHVRAAELMILSYQALPAGQAPGPEIIGRWGTAQVARAFALAFTLSAPFLLMSALYNLTLGVINRAMPQLMVAFVGAPVITFGAIGLLFLAAPLLLSVWVAAVNGFLAAPFEMP